MIRLCVVTSAACLYAVSASASDRSDILAMLTLWNDDDPAKAITACANDAVVIDDIPPYEWRGPGACANWAKDYDRNALKNQISDATGTIGTPKQFIVNGDRAYVVFPATFSYTEKGKPVKNTATVTFSLQKTALGWRITAWTWGLLTTS